MDDKYGNNDDLEQPYNWPLSAMLGHFLVLFFLLNVSLGTFLLIFKYVDPSDLDLCLSFIQIASLLCIFSCMVYSSLYVTPLLGMKETVFFASVSLFFSCVCIKKKATILTETIANGLKTIFLSNIWNIPFLLIMLTYGVLDRASLVKVTDARTNRFTPTRIERYSNIAIFGLLNLILVWMSPGISSMVDLVVQTPLLLVPFSTLINMFLDYRKMSKEERSSIWRDALTYLMLLTNILANLYVKINYPESLLKFILVVTLISLSVPATRKVTEWVRKEAAAAPETIDIEEVESGMQSTWREEYRQRQKKASSVISLFLQLSILINLVLAGALFLVQSTELVANLLEVLWPHQLTALLGIPA